MAKDWAEQVNLAYVPLNVSQVIATHDGLESKDIDSMDLRLKVQRKLVEACGKTFLHRRDVFITDRTPLDVAAYTLADVGQGALTQEQQDEVVSIVNDCIDITNAAFGTVILVQPGISYVQEKGKPLPNVAYQEHVHQLIVGLCADERMRRPWFSLPREITDHEKRLGAIDEVYDEMIENVTYEAQANSHH